LNLRTPQQGAALLALAALLVLATSWMLVSAFASVAGNPAAHVARNARALAEAKAALIAWVARTALDATESNPGRLPCPQAWGDLGSANEGRAAAVCAATAAGWLPWRSLGLPVMLDAAGQQLWYVVSPGWHLPNGGASLTINSNTAGQLLLDGQPVIALLIAPGAALNIAPDAAQRAAGCSPRRQSRARDPRVQPNARDFLDCQNGSTADNVFVSAVAGHGNPVFNDQVLAITAADLLPALEAAIAKRIERDIVPPLRSVYASAAWGLSAANPLFPFAAPFANPGTSSFDGAAGTFQGLLPFNRTRNGWAATPPNAYLAGPYGRLLSQSCTWEEAGEIRACHGEYEKDGAQPGRALRIEMTATFTNVAMGLRTIDATRMQVLARDRTGAGPWQSAPVTHRATINPDGSATIVFGATLPSIDDMGWGSSARFRVRIERAVIADHPLLAPGTPGTGWFVRNEWYRLLYYATAPAHAASAAAPRSCDHLAPSCLQVANLAPASKQRAILILAGRSLGSATRPNASLEDFLDSPANRDGDNAFEQLAVNRAFNDRVVVLDANP
jgi:hypothetical protein